MSKSLSELASTITVKASACVAIISIDGCEPCTLAHNALMSDPLLKQFVLIARANIRDREDCRILRDMGVREFPYIIVQPPRGQCQTKSGWDTGGATLAWVIECLNAHPPN